MEARRKGSAAERAYSSADMCATEAMDRCSEQMPACDDDCNCLAVADAVVERSVGKSPVICGNLGTMTVPSRSVLPRLNP